MHPKALLRCSDSLFEAVITLLDMCERAGICPESVEMVIIVLPPTPDSGFRPIGLLPHLGSHLEPRAEDDLVAVGE